VNELKVSRRDFDSFFQRSRESIVEEGVDVKNVASTEDFFFAQVNSLLR